MSLGNFLCDFRQLLRNMLFYLFLCFQFVYTMTCAVCSRTAKQQIQILKKFSQVPNYLNKFSYT